MRRSGGASGNPCLLRTDGDRPAHFASAASASERKPSFPISLRAAPRIASLGGADDQYAGQREKAATSAASNRQWLRRARVCLRFVPWVLLIRRTLYSPCCADDAVKALTQAAMSTPARARDFQQQRAAARIVAIFRESGGFGHVRQTAKNPAAARPASMTKPPQFRNDQPHSRRVSCLLTHRYRPLCL